MTPRPVDSRAFSLLFVIHKSISVAKQRMLKGGISHNGSKLCNLRLNILDCKKKSILDVVDAAFGRRKVIS